MSQSELINLDESKATQSNDIPTKVIKENYDIFATCITENFNNMIESSVFPDSLEQVSKPILSQYTKKIPGMKRKLQACKHFTQLI